MNNFDKFGIDNKKTKNDKMEEKNTFEDIQIPFKQQDMKIYFENLYARSKGRNQDDDKSVWDMKEAYFDSGEKSYFNTMMLNPENAKLHENLLRFKIGTLKKMACCLMEEIEMGKFDEAGMKKAEFALTHILGAVEELQKVKERENQIDNTKKKALGKYAPKYKVGVKEDERPKVEMEMGMER